VRQRLKLVIDELLEKETMASPGMRTPEVAAPAPRKIHFSVRNIGKEKDTLLLFSFHPVKEQIDAVDTTPIIIKRHNVTLLFSLLQILRYRRFGRQS